LYIYLLGDGDIAVRIAASGALGHIDDDHAVEPLIAALRYSERDIRKSAVYALGIFGDLRAVEPLIAALKDECSDVREAACSALGKSRIASDHTTVTKIFANLHE
jgi:HEAT repeat protein